MNCPKCGSEEISLLSYPNDTVSVCMKCRTRFTVEQHKRIRELEARVLRAETGAYYVDKKNIELEAELAKIKAELKSLQIKSRKDDDGVGLTITCVKNRGPIPQTGQYWVKGQNNPSKRLVGVTIIDDDGNEVEWAGPILPTEEE